jgi:hypothetical protein
LLAISLMLAATTGVQAQSTRNDVGVNVTPTTFNFTLPPVVPASRGLVSCPPVGAVAAAFTGATTQDGRIFRDAMPSVCPSKVYPGIFGAGAQFNFETFSYANTSAAAACVTVNFNPDTVGTTPCTTNAHASAYLGSYDPTNQATNFVGDVGSSVAQPFLFEVPAGQNMVLVVSNTSAAAICDFGFEVINLPCTSGTPTLAVSTVALDFGGQAVGASSNRTLTVSNVGTAALQVTGIAAPTAPFSVVGGTCGAVPFSLAAAASCTVDYRFTPAAGGAFANAVAITSDGGNITVNLSGRGVVAIPLNALTGWNSVLLLSLLGLSTLVLVRRRA